jgi:hypothetical protein
MAQGRRKWTAEEDRCLREAVQRGEYPQFDSGMFRGEYESVSLTMLAVDLVAVDGDRPLLWREIAKSVPGRSNKDCRRRWCNSLTSGLSKGFWTESEDERLWNAVRKHGTKWAVVAQDVHTRNADQCSSHWSQTLDPHINYSDWTREEVSVRRDK